MFSLKFFFYFSPNPLSSKLLPSSLKYSSLLTKVGYWVLWIEGGKQVRDSIPRNSCWFYRSKQAPKKENKISVIYSTHWITSRKFLAKYLIITSLLSHKLSLTYQGAILQIPRLTLTFFFLSQRRVDVYNLTDILCSHNFNTSDQSDQISCRVLKKMAYWERKPRVMWWTVAWQPAKWLWI